MPNIYASANDGYINKFDVGGGWAAVRDATSGTRTFATSTSNNFAIHIIWAAKGAGLWAIERSFFDFDTSGITVAPSSATFNVQTHNLRAADFFVVKSTQSTSLANADFDAITGWSIGVDNEGNVTKYSSEITTPAPSGYYNNISLTSAALSDMASLSTFKICLIESVHDLRNVDPATDSANLATGLRFSEYGGTAKDPYIDYTAGVAAAADNATFFGTNF